MGVACTSFGFGAAEPDDKASRAGRGGSSQTNHGRIVMHEQYRDGRNLEARAQLHERFSTNPLGLHPWLLAQMDVPPHASVLELGCGVGAFWVTNRERIPPDWRVTLTDISPGMVREARDRLRGYHPGFTFAAVAADALPYPDATFDAVFAHFMLYHVDDRPRALGEIARVLRPGGQLCAATNGSQHMREAWDLALRAGLMTSTDLAAGDAVAFSLENGADQLRPSFAEVTLRRYEDRLVVTEAEPLAAYILSASWVQATLASLDAAEREERVSALRALIDHRLAEDGQVAITKDSGVFVARHP